MSILEASRVDDRDKRPAFEPRYEMTNDEVRQMTAQLLYEQKSALPENMPFVCLRIKSSSPFANLARNIEGEVFVNDLNEDRENIKRDWEPYEEQSYFFIVIDVNECRPAGTLRIVENGAHGFMTLNDISEPPHNISTEQFCEDYDVDLDKTWEVGTIAVVPEYRRSANATFEQKITSYVVSGLLYRSLYAGARANGIDNFVSMIDQKALHTLRNLGIPFVDIYDLPAKDYKDGTTYQPAFADVTTFDEKMRAFAQALIDAAETEKDKKRAKDLQDMIIELLTGNALDGMMAFRYNNASTNSVI